MLRNRLFAAWCLLVILIAPRRTAEGASFVRADVNADGRIDITDGVRVLGFLFVGGEMPPCLDAADTNDSGDLNITDGIFVLNFLFIGGSTPPAPFSGMSTYGPADCGDDPTGDPLGCAAFAPCGGIGPAVTGPQEPPHEDADSDAVLTAGHVVLPSGEARLERVDLRIPGRGEVHFVLLRCYRSRLRHDGPLGFGWDFVYDERLQIEANGDVLRRNGRGRLDRWRRLADERYEAPAGFFGTLRRLPAGTFTLRSPRGYIRAYDASGLLLHHEDRHGNRMLFQRDARGNLARAIDPYGRVVQFQFETGLDGTDRLRRVVDFAGREVVYTMDARGDLVAVRSPIVAGTSTGNDFPAGRTEEYAYLSGSGNELLEHNLASVTFPEESAEGGSPAVEFVYGTSGQLELDRVLTETVGGTNASGVAAGGERRFQYEEAAPGGVPAGALDVERTLVRVTERNGNEVEAGFNELGHLIRHRRLSRGLRQGEPVYFETRCEYTVDHLLVRRVFPAGNEMRVIHDTTGPRAARANVLELRRLAGQLPGGEDLVTTFTYEPLHQMPASMTDPRGYSSTFFPPLGTATPERYTVRVFFDYQEGNGPVPDAIEHGIDLAGIARGLGDLNGDGRVDGTAGDAVRAESTAVELPASSNEAQRLGDRFQEVVQEMRWNDRGQLVSVVDSEGNVHRIERYPERDPDGDGVETPPGPLALSSDPTGFPRAAVEDAEDSARRSAATPPAVLETAFGYDSLGRLVWVRNPRGVVTALEVNALGEIVAATRGADVAAAVASGQLRTEATPFSYRERRRYDANGRLVLEEREDRGATAGVGDWLERAFVHDILGNLIELSVETGTGPPAVTRLRYDPNELIREIVQPEGNRIEILHDERDLPFLITRGAATAEASTTRRDYDANGNLARVIGAADRDGDGSKEERTFDHDGFDRPIAEHGPLGFTLETTYDPASRVVGERMLGHPAGRPDQSPVRLAECRLARDELGRIFRVDEDLFLPDGYTPARPAALSDGDADGVVTTRIEHDALSRPTFLVEDDGGTSRLVYDGASRVVEGTDAFGNRRIAEHDRNGNVTLIRSFERATDDLVPVREYLTHWVYDQLDRLVRISADRTQRFAYDAHDRLVLATDAQGTQVPDPLGLEPGTTNTPGNVRRWTHDGRGLVTAAVAELRDGGTGDGAIDGSNPFNADGIAALHQEYDGNGRLVARIDDAGSRTEHRYDALDRLVEKMHADGTTHRFAYDGEDDLIEATDPNGSRIRQTFDALGRLARIEVDRGASVAGTVLQTFSYDGISRLVLARDEDADGAARTVARVYDSLSRLLEETQDGAVISTEWSGDGKDLATTYPGGRRIERTHDAIDRVASIRETGVPLAAMAWRGPRTRLLEREHANGTRLSLIGAAGDDSGYDEADRIARLLHLRGVTSFVDRGYEHNRVNERLSETRFDDGGRTDRFLYDSLYRLVRSVYDAGGTVPRPLVAAAYALDGVANRRVEETDGTAGPVAITYQVNAVHEYVQRGGVVRTHDANGNVTSDGAYRYAYDFKNRLREVSNASTGAPIARYEYDAVGRRARKTVFDPAAPGVVLRSRSCHHDDAFRLLEEAESGGTEATYVHAPGIDAPIQVQTAGGAQWLHAGARGDIVAVTDAAGQVVERRVYDDFGQASTQGTSASPFGFHGRELDAETGLHYFRMRHYDPRTGRFLQRDPVWDPNNRGSPYAFAGSSPITHGDPMGLDSGFLGWKDLIGYSGDGVQRESTIGSFVGTFVTETPRSVAYGSVVLLDQLTLEKVTTFNEAAEQTYVELGFSRKERAVHQGIAHVTAFALHSLALDGAVVQVTGKFKYGLEALQKTEGALGVTRAGGTIALDAVHVAESAGVRFAGTGIRGFLTRFWYRAAGAPHQRTLIHEWWHRQLMAPWLARIAPRLQQAIESRGWDFYKNRAWARVLEEWLVETGANWSIVRNLPWAFLRYTNTGKEVFQLAPKLVRGVEHLVAGLEQSVFGALFWRMGRNEYTEEMGAPPPVPMTLVGRPPEVSVVPDNFVIPPGATTQLDVAVNDVVPPGTVFEFDPPAGFHPNLFAGDPSGTFRIATLLPAPPSFQLSYTAILDGIPLGTAQVDLTVAPKRLYELEEMEDPQTGDRFVEAPCLVLDGLHYPIYQFRLTNNPNDVCREPHWHASSSVFPLESPAIGRFDPDPPRCGFGRKGEVPEASFRVSPEEWQDFLIAHIPPF